MPKDNALPVAVTDALAAVHRDLQRTGVISLTMLAGEPFDPSVSDLWMKSKSGYLTGLVFAEDTGPGEQLAYLAEQVQVFVHEELCYLGLPVLWPQCPEHCNSHPLDPVPVDNAAWWICPKSYLKIAKIGGLKSLDVSGSGSGSGRRTGTAPAD